MNYLRICIGIDVVKKKQTPDSAIARNSHEDTKFHE